jgi:hypothetical protein
MEGIIMNEGKASTEYKGDDVPDVRPGTQIRSFVDVELET